MQTLELSGQALTLAEIDAVAAGKLTPVLSQGAIERIAASRRVVEDVLARNQVVYGVNTGFGKLADVHVPPSEIEALQVNLVHSHSSGLGRPLSIPETRALMVLRANVFALGY